MHVFDDKLEQNCPFTKTFGTLINKPIGHQQMFLFSTLHLSEKLSRPKCHEFSIK